MNSILQTAQDLPVRLEMVIHDHLCLFHRVHLTCQLIFQIGINTFAIQILQMKKYSAVIEIFSAEKGGRPCMPVGDGYSPHACSIGGSEHLPVVLYGVPTRANLDQEFKAIVEFLYPDQVDYSNLTSGKIFNLLEGVKIVGKARILGN